jgi:hypothetical protein
MTLTQVETLARAVVEREYSSLALATIEVRATLTGDEYFFDTRIPFRSLVRSASSRRYVIRVNPKLLESPPSAEALTAILVHELAHVRDYHQRSPVELVSFLAKFGIEGPSPYERETDLVAITKGYAPGLLEYRCWQFRRLDPAAWQKKRRIYFSPTELFERNHAD